MNSIKASDCYLGFGLFDPGDGINEYICDDLLRGRMITGPNESFSHAMFRWFDLNEDDYFELVTGWIESNTEYFYTDQPNRIKDIYDAKVSLKKDDEERILYFYQIEHNFS